MTKKKIKADEPNVEIKENSSPMDIWEDIKNVQINMFSLPNQTVEQYCSVVSSIPNQLFLLLKVSSVLTALEDVLGSKYNFETADKYIIVSKK